MVGSTRDRIYPGLTDVDRWADDLRTNVGEEAFRGPFENSIRARFGNVHPVVLSYLWGSSKQRLLSKFRLEADNLAKKAVEEAEIFFSVIRWDKLAEDLAERGQISVLTDFHQKGTSSSSDPMKLWQNLHWRAEEFALGSLILGDVTVLQVNTESRIDSAFFGDGQRTMIVLPISNNLLLIGPEQPDAKPPAPDALNRSPAELSLQFFISSQNRTEYEGIYHSLVGRKAPRQERESPPRIGNM